MKGFKSCCMVLVLACVLLMGGKVKAAEPAQVTSEEIITRMQEKMRQVKVMQIEMLFDKQTMMVMVVDSNTGNSYVNFFGAEVWGDEKAKISYMKENGKYYFVPSESDDNRADIDEVLDTENSTEVTYDGIVTYENQECYKLKIAQTAEGETVLVEYYIDMQYRLVAEVTYSEGRSSEVVVTYPESYSIPEEVKKKAELIAGYEIKKSKVTYVSKYVKGKTVFYADSAKGAKGSVKIQDSIKVCGRTYKVYGISNGALKGNKKITSVTIGKNVAKIGKQAFYKCSKLKTVKINSKRVNYIGSKAFYGNAKKLKVKVPKVKFSKYKKMITKQKTSSKITVTKF